MPPPLPTPLPSLPVRTVMVSSSPGRAEKLPTPGLARLLHRNSGSRSRGRSSLSRSSPLFPSRTRTLGRAAATLDAGEQGEPSSPKVTCIGQVRIRKKKNKTTTASSFISSNPKRNRPQCEKRQGGDGAMRCRCLDKALLCSVFHRRRKSSAADADLRPIWRRWLMGLRFEGNGGYRRRKEPILEADEAAPTPPSRALGEIGSGIAFVESERDDVEKGECDGSRVFVPPKNALILMRCRSAPHNRFSALATRFPAAGGDYGSRINGVGEEEDGKGAARIGSESGDGGEGKVEEEEEEEEEDKLCPPSRPLFLKRCKSEPAKKAEWLVAVEAAVCSQNGGGSGNRRLAVDEGPSPVH